MISPLICPTLDEGGVWIPGVCWVCVWVGVHLLLSQLAVRPEPSQREQQFSRSVLRGWLQGDASAARHLRWNPQASLSVLAPPALRPVPARLIRRHQSVVLSR